jgi:hypothetical protein
MIFMMAATWPDRIKSDPDYHIDGSHSGNRPPTDGTADRNTGYDDKARHKYWHFVDMPFTQDGTPLPAFLPFTPNAKTRITDFRAVLASTTASNRLKSYDLAWLLHLIGDVHQPLHCTARVSADDPEGDDGGNGVVLETSPGNLHSYWDGLLGKTDEPVVASNAIASLPTPPTAAVNDLNVDHWVQESFAAAKRLAYAPPVGTATDDIVLNQTYKDNARAFARSQIALAGARLARILNTELK